MKGESGKMADYIDRRAAVAHIKKRLIETAIENAGYMADAGIIYEEIEENRIDTWINELTAADVVEVVRCKDCRWWDEFPNNTANPEYHTCKRPFVQLSMAAWDFCSRGERKDG